MVRGRLGKCSGDGGVVRKAFRNIVEAPRETLKVGQDLVGITVTNDTVEAMRRPGDGRGGAWMSKVGLGSVKFGKKCLVWVLLGCVR